jgi:GTP cyclohydrolase II
MKHIASGTDGVAALRARLAGKLHGTPSFVDDDEYCPSDDESDGGQLCVVEVARAQLPTRYGRFVIVGFYDGRERKEHTAIIKGDVRGAEDCPLRIHSECHTGDVLGSLRCDCREQLEAALRYVGSQPFGVVIYMKQEGRGIGLLNKLKAYQLQDLGLDTIEANLYLGFPEDARDYKVAARIIGMLGIRSVLLLTNNPAKIDGLEDEGVLVSGRVPLVIRANPYNAEYLHVKKSQMGHLF